MAGPEANFWAQIRRNMPKDCFATRIENRAGGGFPDVDMLLGGFPLKIELKISKNDRAFLSPHQIAWHTAYNAHGGPSFFLIKTPGPHQFCLYPGSMAVDLHHFPLSEVQGSRFADLGSMFCALRVAVIDHYRRALRAVD